MNNSWMHISFGILILMMLPSQFVEAVASLDSANSQPYVVVSKIVGQVSDYYITSREVQAQNLIGNLVLANIYLKNEKTKEESLPLIESADFQGALNQSILEKIVSLEADSLAFAQLSDSEVFEFKKKAETVLKNKPTWRELQVDEHELETWLNVKRRAQKFIEYKTESSSMKISDEEVRNYFEQNRYKFGSSSFLTFKDNIRQFLLKQKIESSLKEWFEVLRKKYKVRTFIQNVS